MRSLASLTWSSGKCHGPSGIAAASAAFNSATPSPVCALTKKVSSNFTIAFSFSAWISSFALSATSTLLRIRNFFSGRSAMLSAIEVTLRAGAALAVDHQRDHVGALRPAPGGGDHRAVEPALGFEDAGRVDQQQLRLPLDRDAHQPRARGLRLGTDDRDLLADQRVDQRRFARIGRADDGDEAAMGHDRSLSPAIPRRRRFPPGACCRPPRWLRQRLADRHRNGEARRVAGAGAIDDFVHGRLAVVAAAHS